ncbi:hypothetical protein Y032_0005g2476 [Ancylostoma ceylanicum]|uniref:Uncharacterized protein n=1 Tax=Ancylostoma ceylanicum TaxID=53326 RepID=A0A016VS65_9BILA|nr:hypothetical protein Y032_0005g2476 [Ancylostoma ceylanicum]
MPEMNSTASGDRTDFKLRSATLRLFDSDHVFSERSRIQEKDVPESKRRFAVVRFESEGRVYLGDLKDGM